MSITKTKLPAIIVNNKKNKKNYGKVFLMPKIEKSSKLYLEEIRKNDYEPIETRDIEIELFKKYKNGCLKSKNKLIVSNLRFVVSVAKTFQNQGLTFEDLVNEGNLGLIKALERYDPNIGVKFFSYAVWWIRQSIMQAIMETGKIVRIPTNKKESYHLINKHIDKLTQKFERTPTLDEIVESVGEFDNNKINEILKTNFKQISLDEPVFQKNGDEDTTMNDLLPSYKIYESSKQQKVLDDVTDLLSVLSEMERDIIIMHYGIFSDDKYTLEEIGAKYKLSRERVRQIEDKAIKKLRNNPKIEQFFNFAINED
jgi:RNA polymerase primary sigma factor